MRPSMLLAVLVSLVACGPRADSRPGTDAPVATVTLPAEGYPEVPPLAAHQARAIFAMGCFWCAESDLEPLDGVVEVWSGYAGGEVSRPRYKSLYLTRHAEVVQVVYDTRKTDYATLLTAFWHGVDPFDGGGQFCDRGSQYRPAILPVDDAQRAAAEASMAKVEAELGREVAVTLEPTEAFWPAEAYHQDFHRTNPEHYARYRQGCRRDARLEAVWGDAALGAH